jgi:hypothetical protein
VQFFLVAGRLLVCLVSDDCAGFVAVVTQLVKQGREYYLLQLFLNARPTF